MERGAPFCLSLVIVAPVLSLLSWPGRALHLINAAAGAPTDQPPPARAWPPRRYGVVERPDGHSADRI